MEKATEKPNKKWKRCKFVLIVFNIIVLVAVVVAVVTYISINPNRTYTHHHYNYSVLKSNDNKSSIDPNNYNSSVCLPITHKKCMGNLPYKFFQVPNNDGPSLGIDLYSHVIDVKCYELLPLLLCVNYLPKCSTSGDSLPPCRALCIKAKRRCEYFMGVYQLKWPEELDCDILPESPDDTICVGQKEFLNEMRKYKKCEDGLLCDDDSRCVLNKFRCDGTNDCQDGSDEKDCDICSSHQFSCQHKQCIDKSKVCNGVQDCPNNNDELHCFRIEGIMGDIGFGKLEAYNSQSLKWLPVCSHEFDTYKQASACQSMGYQKLLSGSVGKGTTSSRNTIMVDWSKQENTLRLLPTTSSLIRKKSCDVNTDEVFVECGNFECGKPSVKSKPKRRQSRIVGGYEVEPGSWPWLVGLHGGQEEVFFCGGVLISDTYVMTAGHCIGQQNSTNGVTLKVGKTRRNSFSSFSQKRSIRRYIKHPDFVSDSKKLDNDIILIELDRPIEFNPHTKPACLPERTPTPGSKCTMIGWGKKMEGYAEDYMDTINRVELPILSLETCQLWYSAKYYTLTESMLCAGYEEGGKDACNGDSGGPLLCEDANGRWFVAGLASWGYGCAQPFYPGVYANVYKFVPWIQQIMSNSTV